MDKLLITLNKLLSQLKIFLYEFYNKLLFFFNKQLTLQKMYEPLTESKNKTNKELTAKLTTLRNGNISLSKNSEKLTEENNLLKDKISSLQEMLFKK